MLTPDEAISLLKNVFKGSTIGLYVEYGDLYIVQVFRNLPGEGDYDPFYSVNKTTGMIMDYSIITDGDTQELNRLFLEAKDKQNGRMAR